MHVFYVQGGGLGHLVRTKKLIHFFKIPIKDVLIITPSLFKYYFKDYKFISLSWKSSVEDWTSVVFEILSGHQINSFYIDVFPLGLKGELIPIYKSFKDLSCIYVSRILKWEFYLSEMPELYNPIFDKTLVIEPLYSEHFEWIKLNSKELTEIKLPSLTHKNHDKVLSSVPYAIVVHSGGKKEVLDLCKKAECDLKNVSCKIVVFTQVSLEFNDPKFVIVSANYPISQYFKNALRIYTAAGFNCIHELREYRYKHIAIPIAKMYDDQLFRLKKYNH